MSEGYVKVGRLGEFPAGRLKKVQLGGEYVLVANVGGKIYAISNTCTHRGGPLDEGELKGNIVTCPCLPRRMKSPSTFEFTPLMYSSRRSRPKIKEED